MQNTQGWHVDLGGRGARSEEIEKREKREERRGERGDNLGFGGGAFTWAPRSRPLPSPAPTTARTRRSPPVNTAAVQRSQQGEDGEDGEKGENEKEGGEEKSGRAESREPPSPRWAHGESAFRARETNWQHRMVKDRPTARSPAHITQHTTPHCSASHTEQHACVQHLVDTDR